MVVMCDKDTVNLHFGAPIIERGRIYLFEMGATFRNFVSAVVKPRRLHTQMCIT